MTWDNISSKYEENACILTISIPKSCKNIESCDIYVGQFDFLFACDTIISCFKTCKRIDTIDLKNLEIKFNSIVYEFSCTLPCLPEDMKTETIRTCETHDEITQDKSFNISNLRRITESCTLTVDGEIKKFDNKFGYGFACKFRDDTCLIENTLSPICKITNPSKFSPILRWKQREVDEAHDFCRDQYKLNFIELPVPEGMDNPMKFTYNFDDIELNKDQIYILENICNKKYEILEEEQSYIDCGLVEILLAICYDIRSMENETTCESGWTRSILSANLTYFEPIGNLKDCLKTFLRRSLTYPLYRNYEFSRTCVQDVIEGLHHGKSWIIKQFMITYDVFQTCLDSRQLLNYYFIEDYLRYLKIVTNQHLNTISLNLKNASMNITKKDIGLNLNEIETELLKELVDDIHIANSTDSDDEEDDDNKVNDGDNESSKDNTKNVQKM